MPENKRAYYEKWAKYFVNTTISKKLDTIAFVEGRSDKVFWGAVFAQAGIRAKLMSGDDTGSASGKNECLKYLPHISSKRFLICIDSDYDYLKPETPRYGTRQFVLQTYTYAIENHYLAITIEARDFLQTYSRIIFNAFLHHLSTNTHIRDFCNTTVPDNMSAGALENLQNRLETQYPEQLENTYTRAGLIPENTYLYIEAKLLCAKIPTNGYLSDFSYFPMNKIMADISALFAA